ARVNGKAGRDPGETEAFGCTPLPESPSDCGLPGASSATCSAAPRGPVCVGSKATPIVQFAAGATVAPAPVHVLEAILKSPGFAPPKVTVLTCSGELPLLVTVTVCEAVVWPTTVSAKAGTVLAGEVVTPGCKPLPESPNDWGLPGASSATWS